jgi:hypothetical protein
MDLKHFVELINKVKLYIKSKPSSHQNNLTLVNGDGVRLRFIAKNFSKLTKNKITIECMLCENTSGDSIRPQMGKILVLQGAPLIYEELVKNDKLDWVKWHFEEFILGKV